MAGESAGERATADALEALPRAQWRVLDDVPWPGRPRDAVDHVVVGPAGVFVIDAKNWSGTVTVGGGVLRLDKYSRQGALTHAAEAARAISGRLRTTRCPVTPVLCLVRSEPISAECEGVLVCSTANVAELLRSRPRVLVEAQVQRLAQGLLADQPLPLVPAVLPSARGRSARGVTYLVGALVALGMALTLVASPETVTGAVEDFVRWIAERVDEA